MPKNKQQESLKNQASSDKSRGTQKPEGKGAAAPKAGQSETQAKRH